MAYFVLPGTGKRVYRLAVARRIVDASARGARDRSPAGLARRRTRVLRRAMRPSRRLHIGLGPWLRALPTRLPDPALTAALARLHPHVRVAYVLRHVEGLPRYAVHDQLVELRIRDPWQAIRAADAVRPPGARHAERFEPALLRPVRNRSVLPLVMAAVLTAALVAVLVVTERGAPPGPALRLASADPGAWTGGARTLDAWLARGDLARDRTFTRAAAAAWAAAPADRRATGTAQLLYAGNVGGTPLAVMRQGARVARYAEGGLDVVTAGHDTSAPIALGGGRYLLAPWDPRPETLSGDALAVTDGVTEPARAGSDCGRGPVFHVGSRTVGDLGGPRATVLGYQSPAHRPGGRDESEPEHERLGRGARAFWDRLACAPHPADGADRPVTEAAAWNFWSGRLPRGGGSADWVCTRLTFGDGATAAAATLLAKKDLATGPCDARRPVSGTWWKAPTDRWYYLAAAARGLVPRADGVRRSTVRARLLTATGDRDEPVQLTAR
ncbi:hypothetical protein E1200_00555 [Actinomadura sp. GC306]|uniref:hypothetical protein n=1 Tax=Actinomadura sp. GC306 TaxID=2530367 RepID=UPI00104CECAB|nr:hypothetical protein [Actinomadura sp. GC306]TDC71890.1 hypothetical protein E1200_00555 [Actinomadura sp. GC306]